MNSKQVEYSNKDIAYLKKDIFFRAFFAVMLLFVFAWQFVLMIKTATESYLSIMQICSSVIVFVCCLLMSFISILYALKNFRIIAAIKMNGKCVSSVQMLIRTNKRGFLWLYNLLMQFLTLAISLVLICSLVYSFLQATYLSTVSFYLPLLLMVCISGYNSIYHVKDELHTQNTVQEFNGAL